MAESKLIELSYFDPSKEVRLTVYADTIIMDRKATTAPSRLCAPGDTPR